MTTSDLEIEGQGHKTIAFVALPISTHIPNLKVLTKLFFKLSRPKGNLCGGGVTVLNPKYPRLSSGDTNINTCMIHHTIIIWVVSTVKHNALYSMFRQRKGVFQNSASYVKIQETEHLRQSKCMLKQSIKCVK